MKNRFKNYLVGSDIEVFLFNELTGEVISAEGIIPGSKYDPFKLDREGCALQLDNISCEFNVPPATKGEEMYENITYVLNHIAGILPEGVAVKISASATLDPKYLQTENAKTMGCDPSFNAWQRCINERPSLEETPNLRVCGGHIHIGYANPDEATSEAIIRAMDKYLGVLSVVLDTDKDRKKLYGKAGEFRFQPYGVEYRVLSNFWTSSKELTLLMFEQIQKALDFVEANGLIEANSEEGLLIQKIINSGDTEAAKEYLQNNEITAKTVIEEYATL